MLGLVEQSKDWFENPWYPIGLGGQALFAIRLVVQWIASERAERVVVPIAYWWISVAAAVVTLTYGILDRDVTVVIGQSTCLIVYVRNLQLDARHATRGGE
jgi:lipid-A-disaccharide synthase-like uncharacterized protein